MLITLDQSATVREAAILAAQLADGMARADTTLTIDADAVVEADLSLLQLIEVTRRDMPARGGAVQLRTPANPAIAAVLERAGFLAAANADDLQFWFHGDRQS